VLRLSVPILRTKPHFREHLQAWAVQLAQEGLLEDFTTDQLWHYLRNHSRSILSTIDEIAAGTGPDPQNILAATIEFMALDCEEYRAGGDEFTFEQDVATAVDFREQLSNYAELPSRVCCCCNRKQSAYDMCEAWMPFSEVAEELEALRIDQPSTPHVPRNGNTTWTYNGIEYHVQAQPWAGAVREGPDYAEPQLRFCKECWRTLHSASPNIERRVPAFALARADWGLPPDWYQPLTLVENCTVAPQMVLRHLVTLTPCGSHLPVKMQQMALAGHCVSFEWVPPHVLAASFPCALADLPEFIRVVFVGVAATIEDARKLARESPTLRVRGALVVHMAQHMLGIFQRRSGAFKQLPLNLNEDAMQQLSTFDGVPESLLATAINIPPGADANAVLRTLREDPVGYARSRFNAPAEVTQAALDLPQPAPSTGDPIIAAAVAANASKAKGAVAAALAAGHTTATSPDADNATTPQIEQQVDRARNLAAQVLQRAHPGSTAVQELQAAHHPARKVSLTPYTLSPSRCLTSPSLPPNL
jgi:hypothetical protein